MLRYIWFENNDSGIRLIFYGGLLQLQFGLTNLSLFGMKEGFNHGNAHESKEASS